MNVFKVLKKSNLLELTHCSVYVLKKIKCFNNTYLSWNHYVTLIQKHL